MRKAIVLGLLPLHLFIWTTGCVDPGKTSSHSPATIAAAGSSDSKGEGEEIPRLEQRDGMTKLIVNGRPYICVAGEVHNGSSTDFAAMERTIHRLAEANLNTILSVVSWDMIEPVEGRFDFSIIDYQIRAAREARVRLIFLWFGSWKNGLSHYIPEWVKSDQRRFPRVVNEEGNTLEILSTLSEANRDADTRAFAAMMRYIREIDSEERTVIMVQVQNEVGASGTTRDFSEAANTAFNGPVPEELIAWLQTNRDRLHPELKAAWGGQGYRTSGTWEEVFGENVPRTDKPVPNSPDRERRAENAVLYDYTDEIFMAWNYAQYIGHIAEIGKREYPLPMFVNAWIVQPMDTGPGDYPSGGPQPRVLDIWHAGAPSIDILAPDIYLPEFNEIAEAYKHNDNPLFVPETGRSSDNAWSAFTQLDALCYSPFGIDSLTPDSGFSFTYGLLDALSGAIAAAQGRPGAIRLIELEADAFPEPVTMGGYVFDFSPPPPSRWFRQPETQFPERQGAAGFMYKPYLVIVQATEDEFYFASNGYFPFRVGRRDGDDFAAPAVIDLGYFEDGDWLRTRRMNGDDLMGRGYDVSGAAADGWAGTQVPLGDRIRGRLTTQGQGSIDSSREVLRVRFYKYR
jgi:hypothetical protein